MKPIVFFDLETTGTDVREDQIVQIACVKFDGEKMYDERNVLLNPDVPIRPGAQDVHGISKEMVKDCPKFSQIAKSLFEYFDGCDIGGQNVLRFDIPMLNFEFKRAGIDWDFSGINFIDTLAIDHIMRPRKLGYLYKMYTGKELEGAHDALADVKASIEVFKHQNEILGFNMDIPAIDKYSQGDKERVDVSGRLYRDKEGVLRWNFSQNINKAVLDTPDFARWYLSKNPAEDTEYFIRKELKQ